MATYEVNVEEVEPMSRTYQYRKVMKPMLERKRRARINKCLDDLKDLMVSALQSEGESITKLEKADVLELTVRHLKKLKQHHALSIPAQNQATEKFRAGYAHCASEVRRFVQAVPGVDMHISSRLLSHLGRWMSQFDNVAPLSNITTAPNMVSPISVNVSPQSPGMTPVNMPRVYTPPASPESNKPIYTAPPQPVKTEIPQRISTVVIYPSSNTITTSSASMANQPQNLSVIQSPPLQVPQAISPRYPPPQTSPVPLQKISSSAVTKSEVLTPINLSGPKPFKIEVPPGSPVWRPW